MSDYLSVFYNPVNTSLSGLEVKFDGRREFGCSYDVNGRNVMLMPTYSGVNATHAVDAGSQDIMAILETCNPDGIFNVDKGRCEIQNVCYSPEDSKEKYRLTWQQFSSMDRPAKLEVIVRHDCKVLR